MKTILIVDDEPDLLEILRFTLEEEGYRTFTASRMRDAIGILRREAIDLVLTDVRMPEGDGLQILAEAKRLNPDTSIILMTGFADVNLAEAKAKGATALLSKPFDHGKLLEVVRNRWEGEAK